MDPYRLLCPLIRRDYTARPNSKTVLESKISQPHAINITGSEEMQAASILYVMRPGKMDSGKK